MSPTIIDALVLDGKNGRLELHLDAQTSIELTDEQSAVVSRSIEAHFCKAQEASQSVMTQEGQS